MSAEKRIYFGRALTALVPDGVGYALDDSVEKFEDIIWASGEPYVNKEDLTRKADELELENQGKEYVEKRFMAYPGLHELADAIYWSQKGDNSKMEAYIAKCDSVKETFPK